MESGGTRDSSSTFSSLCSIPGCDGKAMCHPRSGDLVSPCECGYTVCRDCYIEAIESGGKCGGCKHIYKATDPEHRDKSLRYRSDRSDEYGRNDNGGGDDDDDDDEESDQFQIPPMSKEQVFERRLSLLKSFKANNPPLLMGKNTSEFDHSRWLFETKGTYGYGNALWPKDGAYNAGAGAGNGAPDFEKGRRRPLSRKKGISAGIISPYRYVCSSHFSLCREL